MVGMLGDVHSYRQVSNIVGIVHGAGAPVRFYQSVCSQKHICFYAHSLELMQECRCYFHKYIWDIKKYIQ